MSEYIDRQLCEICAEYDRYYRLVVPLDKIRKLPAADVVPVVHGRWVNPHWRNSDYGCDCSVCGQEAMHREYRWQEKGIYPICPNCGAKMDG